MTCRFHGRSHRRERRAMAGPGQGFLVLLARRVKRPGGRRQRTGPRGLVVREGFYSLRLPDHFPVYQGLSPPRIPLPVQVWQKLRPCAISFTTCIFRCAAHIKRISYPCNSNIPWAGFIVLLMVSRSLAMCCTRSCSWKSSRPGRGDGETVVSGGMVHVLPWC